MVTVDLDRAKRLLDRIERREQRVGELKEQNAALVSRVKRLAAMLKTAPCTCSGFRGYHDHARDCFSIRARHALKEEPD